MRQLVVVLFCKTFSVCHNKLINPRSSGKLALYTVSYHVMWKWFEIVPYMLLGVIGGVLGALFNELNVAFVKWKRKKTFIPKYPVVETLFIAFVTGLVCFWNEFTSGSMTELLAHLFNNECSKDAISAESDKIFREICEYVFTFLLYIGLTKHMLLVNV